MGEIADRVLLNGKIVTVDREFSIHEALAIKGERILSVGSTEELKGLISPETDIVDLHGMTVTPGLVDSHNHTVEFGFSGARPRPPVPQRKVHLRHQGAHRGCCKGQAQGPVDQGGRLG